jgi:branched-chain amino acid transport system permease protein
VINWANFISQVFNGVVLGALLALISSGLTIIYGTLGVLNLAHGAMFMLGGYAGWVAYTYTGSFIVAVIAGSLFVMLVGVVMERVVIRYFYSRPHEDQLLVTFGLGIVFVETVRFFFGSLTQTIPPPPALVGITPLGFMFYPTYRLALLGIVAMALIALYVVLYRTRIGMIVRAGIEDSVMVDALGIDVYKVFMLVFGIGAMAAGFAGIINAPVVSIAPDVGESVLVQTFVVIVIERRLVSRSGARRPDRRRDHQHHLDVQPRLCLRHAVRGDDIGAGHASLRTARNGRPRMSVIV